MLTAVSNWQIKYLLTTTAGDEMFKRTTLFMNIQCSSLQWSFVNRIILESIHGRISRQRQPVLQVQRPHEDCQKNGC